ncbi:AfsR/SARP family transcriptional regulator [Bailinhaonella thermotolerans]|uniref:Uncharacterized protein n=1 Tax=Bailinhaonella thermotolerans TaxID=1070861 RepID=A0A3A4AFE5_9ACTN|nr:AfsR/SARP family transcriptional regulator [Bailinhaonella thermotolerans]RJL24730.1 hypothetical protein D5H75_28460 [Bailinhaonella thermotolerans]
MRAGVEGQQTRIGSAKVRTLLALLLVHAGTRLPTCTAIAELWGGHPPKSAHANLRTYASRLRALLVAAGENGDAPARLTGVPDGLILEYDSARCSLDMRDFERDAEQGRRALAEGDCRAAAPLLKRALVHWRGEPFQDATLGPLLSTRAHALRDRRAAAFEDAARAGLHLGEHAEWVPRLRTFLYENPTREHAWALLMRGLYLAGDVGGAVRSYQRARETLAAELGVEPGAELRGVHDAILRRDLPAGERSGRPDRSSGRPRAG